jgi:hypothetical protein
MFKDSSLNAFGTLENSMKEFGRSSLTEGRHEMPELLEIPRP